MPHEQRAKDILKEQQVAKAAEQAKHEEQLKKAEEEKRAAQQARLAARQQQQRPNLGSGTLLPNEARARELLQREHNAPRKVLRHTGPGPESSRAGRPIPSDKPSHRITIDRRNAQNSSYGDWQDRRQDIREDRRNEEGRFTMGRRDRAHILGGIPISRVRPGQSMARDDGGDVDDSKQWTMLNRRKAQEPPQPPTPPPSAASMPAPTHATSRSIFLEGRAQREASAGFGTYTPLVDISARGPQVQAYQPATSTTPGMLQNERTRTETLEQKERDRLHAAREARRLEVLQQEEQGPKKAVQEEDVDPEVKARREERKAKRESKKSKRYGSEEEPLDVYPKGKERDKARRRESLVQDDREAEEARAAALERAELKKQRKLEKAAKKAAAPTPIYLPQWISVSNLASALKVRQEAFAEKLEELGYEETGPDHVLSSENAGLIAMEYNYEAILDKGDSEDLKAREPAVDSSILPPRPPVVTIMGHVDHGKTTLLDYLRKSSVAAGEHGGITQHIGAFTVPMPSGKIITFLDTPGHAAFLSMRQRGANVTDIVILVVAADDSVKPQTIEAINHAKAAKVPIIVAINKIDKEDTNIDRVKQDLARHGVDVEDFGGETQAICVSGKTGQGMEELEEAVILQSEILDMRAETDGPVEGWVVEASIKSMGKAATVLIRRGTVRIGDFIVAGTTWARVRCLRNEGGADIDSAGPGTPVEIDGWRDMPLAGDEVLEAPDEAKAKSVVDYRLEKVEREKLAVDMDAINEYRRIEQERRDHEKELARLAAEAEAEGTELAEEKPKDDKESGPTQVYFIVKGDVSGSVEAVVDSISAIGNKEVMPNILRAGVGQLSESDIEHAAAAKGCLINFNTTLEPHIVTMAKQAKVKIIDHNIIYRLVDDVKAELSKQLKPLVTHPVLGEAEIAQIFEITVKGRQVKSIAGCKVRNGTVSKTARVRVHRGDEKVFDGMFPLPLHFHYPPFVMSLVLI